MIDSLQRSNSSSTSSSRVPSSQTGSGSSTANSDALQQLNDGQMDIAEQDLGEIDSGADFADVAGQLLDMIAPSEGSKVEFNVKGKIPLYKVPAITVSLIPSLGIKVERKNEKLQSQINLGAAVEISAEVDGWVADFSASVRASFNGTLTIVGDSGAEIFDEFLLTMRMLIENACTAASIPSDYQESIVNGIMSEENMNETIENMDPEDRVQLDLTAGISGQASASALGASVGVSANASTTESFTLANNGNDELAMTQSSSSRASAQATATVKIGNFTARRTIKDDGSTVDDLNVSFPLNLLGQSVSCSASAQFKNEILDNVHLKGSISKELPLDVFENTFLLATDWLDSTKHNISNTLLQLNDGLDNRSIANAAAEISTISIGAGNYIYSTMGEQLANEASEAAGTLKFTLSTDLFWTQSSGVGLKISVDSVHATNVDLHIVDFDIKKTQNLFKIEV